MSDMKHSKVITRTPSPNDPSLIEIKKESYFEKLSNVEVQTEKSIYTSARSLAADVMGCLREISSHETPELTIKIMTDARTGEPNRIVKTWTTSKQHYAK